MAAKRKTEKVEEAPEMPPEMEEEESGMGGFGSLGNMMPQETQMHLFKALSEFAMAMDKLVPKSRMPEDAKRHAMAAQKEFLLMVRALIDAKIECVEKKASKEEGPKLKKIDVQ